MKKLILLGLTLTLVCFTAIEAVGQILDIQYLAVPREHVEEFMELHKEVVELSAGHTNATGHWVYAHAYAGPSTLVFVTRFENAAAMEQDSSNAAIGRYEDSIADSKDRAAFDAKMDKYFGWYMEGHSDEVRGVREGGFFKENIDPKQRHVVVASQYNPKWSDLNEFADLYTELLVTPEREAGFADGVVFNTHYRGDSNSFSSVTWYPSWDTFAKAQAAGPDVDPAQMTKFWAMAGRHSDDILVSLASLVDGKLVSTEW